MGYKPSSGDAGNTTNRWSLRSLLDFWQHVTVAAPKNGPQEFSSAMIRPREIRSIPRVSSHFLTTHTFQVPTKNIVGWIFFHVPSGFLAALGLRKWNSWLRPRTIGKPETQRLIKKIPIEIAIDWGPSPIRIPKLCCQNPHLFIFLLVKSKNSRAISYLGCSSTHKWVI